MIERLYSKEDIIFDGFNSKKKIPYRIFNTITTDKKMDKYSTQFYDRNNLLKGVETEKRIIIQAKKIRNMFVHEQWMTIKNNVWDFKTRKELQQLSISDLINAITNILETIEMIGIENNVYKMK